MPFPYRLSTCALLLGALTITTSVSAEDTFRQHDAHVHGVVEFNIAQDGKDLLMEITAPGADVVGFEHTPTNEQQQQALKSAIQKLKNASGLFVFTSSAECQLIEAHVTETLTAQDTHAGHDHEEYDHDSLAGHDHGEHDHNSHAEHDHGEHDHNSHAEHDHGKHDHNSHAEHDHGEHDHDSHAEHDHGEHDHDSHAGHDSHGEFSAQYTFHCDDIEQLKDLQVSWFKYFPTTEKITVQAITETSQKAEQLTPISTQFKF